MKLLITGGTGFFGKALLRHLQAQYAAGSAQLPEQVVVLSRAPELFLARHPQFAELEWLRFHRGDIALPASLPTGEAFTHVLHAAADSTDPTGLTHLQRYEQIVHGTRNMLEFACQTGVRRFLLASSGGVYGPQPAELAALPESYLGMPDPLIPGNVYSVAKRQAEHYCALFQDQCGLETVIARCFAFVGPDLPLDVHFALGNFIRDALWRDEIVVGGDGSPLRSYLDQSDLAHWLLTLLEGGQAGRAYNVGSDQAISIADLAHLVRDCISPGKPVRILGQLAGTGQRNRYIPDIGRARTELGLDVTIPLEAAIKSAAREITAATQQPAKCSVD